ncbi:fumarylacetoacetate hydrolase family protein [Bradyrhizobium sp. Pear77]|uniref:2-keto-4-pentenoate hydratase n=1 Tax=Bradyrhizobium altum TaxID=1571202 RepID=UPI001E314B29|nr:fumarylacetoacetate hydrolase family protein [Bradyrhizobium altum]MCC8953387.1 fumarylacetoacetate hydrolase family protein [Bradyrhizobium altum]
MDRETATDPDRWLKGLAERQWRDYQRIEPGTFFGEPGASVTLAEAYDIQAEVATLRCAEGDAVAGYKIGCIGPGVVKEFGMSGPIHARVFRSELRHFGVTLSHRAFANLAIEGEMAIRVGANGAIVAAFPVIELHHLVFRGSRRTLAELVANNGISAGAVIPHHHAGTPLSRWADARTLSVAVNGDVMDSGALWAMEGGPDEALEWLQKNLGRWQEAVGPGDLILAGTPLGLYPVKPGDHVTVAVDGTTHVECFIS